MLALEALSIRPKRAIQKHGVSSRQALASAQSNSFHGGSSGGGAMRAQIGAISIGQYSLVH